MKTSLKKLRGFGLHKNDSKERRDIRPLPKLDELAQASQVRYLLLLLLLFSFLFVFCLVAEKLTKKKRKKKWKYEYRNNRFVFPTMSVVNSLGLFSFSYGFSAAKRIARVSFGFCSLCTPFSLTGYFFLNSAFDPKF